MANERMFPIQSDHRRTTPHPLQIPWEIAEEAYSVYAAQFGRSQSLERLAERGGFGPGEMDLFLPNWIERCDRMVELKNVLLVMLDSIEGEPMAIQFFDLRIIERAKKACGYGARR